MKHYDPEIPEKIPFSPETRSALFFKRESRTTYDTIRPGKVRIIVEGYVPSEGQVVTNTFTIDASLTDDIANNTRYLAKLLHDQMRVPGIPEWMAGDVVLHYFNAAPGSKPYTYVIESTNPWKTSGTTRQLSEVDLKLGWATHRTARVMRQGRPVELGPDYCIEGESCSTDHTETIE